MYFLSDWLRITWFLKCIKGHVSANLFGSHRVNESQKLLKSAEKHFYPTLSSFWAKLS